MRIGVDLGTTNTVVAAGASALPAASDGATIVPSVVAYPPNGKQLVGQKARARRAIDPINTLFSSKRIIGRRWAAAEVRDFSRRYPFNLDEEQEQPVFVTRAGAKSPQQIATAILEHVLGGAQKDAGDAHVSVAVPAAFGPNQRAATLAAAKDAGLDNVELIDEPLATTRAFAKLNLLPSGPVAVYDLGGGTFELAVVGGETGGETASEVLGIASDLYLGGDDIDRALADLVADAVLGTHHWDLRDDPIVYDRLVLAMERAKRELSTRKTTTSFDLNAVDPALPGGGGPFEITREQVDAASLPIVRRTFLLCDEALATAGVSLSELSSVLLSGGSSQLPIVAEMVRQYFGVEPLCVENPMEVVAIGASIA